VPDHSLDAIGTKVGAPALNGKPAPATRLGGRSHLPSRHKLKVMP
jgi:hypothetical protein